MAKRIAPYLPDFSELDASIARARLSPAEIEALQVIEPVRGHGGGACDGVGAAPPPPNNMGGTSADVEYVELRMIGGEVKQVLKRCSGDGSTAFVDWLNFTFHEDTAHYVGWPGSTLTDGDIVNAVSYALTNIFGFGVTAPCDKGRNFYRRSYVLGEEGYGFVCHGGQRNSVLVMLTGSGVAAAKPGWERRLIAFLEGVAVNPRLTRVDVAHDCYEGEYTPYRALEDFRGGLFRLSRSPVDPEAEQRGNWLIPDNPKGVTFNVGLRTSGKFARIYEKGKQLGDPTSKWVRVEVEYKSVDRVIPFDILVNPGAYLTGAYPAFDWIHEHVERIKTIRNQKIVEKEKKEAWIKTVAGKDLSALLELEEGDSYESRALNLVHRLMDDSRLPRWALLPDYRFSPSPIHESAMTRGVLHDLENLPL